MPLDCKWANIGSAAKLGLQFSILTNIGLLACFKYANFFIESWVEAWRVVGFEMNAQTLKFILPVGISFCTFQTLSYSIDVHRGKLKPTRNFVAFAAFVSFFPQLVAGLIKRAKHLLPQLQIRRKADAHQITSGVQLIVWGMFKKIVVADTCGFYADAILNDNQIMPAPVMWTGLVLFSFQIYGDSLGIPTWPLELHVCLGFNSAPTSKHPISPGISLNFGGAGTIPFPLGLGTMYIFPLADHEQANGKLFGTPWSSF